MCATTVAFLLFFTLCDERECVLCVCYVCVCLSLEMEQFVSLSLSRMLFFSIDENCMKCLFSLSL